MRSPGCETPQTYTELWGGQHTFAVRAVDLAGNPDPSPATFGWTVLGEPTTTILTGPESPTESTEATFTFTSSASNATFMCGLDVPPFVPCTSPWTLTDVAPGAHAFVVYSIADGFTDSAGDDYEWEVLAPLETTITTGPPANTLSTSATFTFSSPRAGATFECSLDTAAFAPCTSPHDRVRAVRSDRTRCGSRPSSTASVEAEPATWSWTVDPPPVVCGGPFTLTANGDAWIEQASAAANHGTDSNLKVTSKSASQNTRALVRFAMPALPAGCVVQSATLQLNASSAVNGRTLQALRVTGSWTEGNVRWNNQPATSGSAATTASGLGLRAWNVLGQVQAAYTAGNQNGFLIRDASENAGSSPEQQFNSREASASRPQLVLAFTQAAHHRRPRRRPPPRLPPTTTTTTTRSADDHHDHGAAGHDDHDDGTVDAPRRHRCADDDHDHRAGVHDVDRDRRLGRRRVGLQSAPANNSGTDASLKVASKPGDNARALVRFDLPAIPAGCQVTNAQLRLFAGSATHGRTLQALRVAAAWTEGSRDLGEPAGDDRRCRDDDIGRRMAGVVGGRSGAGDVLQRQQRLPRSGRDRRSCSRTRAAAAQQGEGAGQPASAGDHLRSLTGAEG